MNDPVNLLKTLSDLFLHGIKVLKYIKKTLEGMKTDDVPDYDFKDICLDENKGELSFWFIGVRLYFDVQPKLIERFGTTYATSVEWGRYLDEDTKDDPKGSKVIKIQEPPGISLPIQHQIDEAKILKGIYSVIENEYPPENRKNQ